MLTVLDLVSTTASEPRTVLNGLVIVLTAVVAGVTYKLFAPVHQFKIANLLDRVEGRHFSATPATTDEESNLEEEEFGSEYEESETEEESDEESKESTQ
jgi:hypothetical protein